MGIHTFIRFFMSFHNGVDIENIIILIRIEANIPANENGCINSKVLL